MDDALQRVRALRPRSRGDAALIAVGLAGVVVGLLADGLLLVVLVLATIAGGALYDRYGARKEPTA